jgi:hypothetical protein
VCTDPRPRVSTRQLQVCVSPGILFPRRESRVSLLQRDGAGGGIWKIADGKTSFCINWAEFVRRAKKVTYAHLNRWHRIRKEINNTDDRSVVTSLFCVRGRLWCSRYEFCFVFGKSQNRIMLVRVYGWSWSGFCVVFISSFNSAWKWAPSASLNFLSNQLFRDNSNHLALCSLWICETSLAN